MGIGNPWDDAYLEPQQKEESSMVFINIQPWQNKQSSVMFINQFPTNHQKHSNLRNCLEANQFIEYDMWIHKKRHPHHDLPQACKERKYIFLVWIWPTENLQLHPRTIFRINERW